MSRRKYNYDICYEIAKQCTCSSEMRRINGSAYGCALKNDWIKDYIWFQPKHQAPLSYEVVYEIAKKYNSHSDFKKGDEKAYKKASRTGWIKDFSWLKKNRRQPYKYEDVLEIAKKCTCSSEMIRLNASAYYVAMDKGWIKEFKWFNRKAHTPYTYEEVYEIAKNYTCSSEFQKGNGSAYGKARENGWIKDYTWFTRKRHKPYTYEACYNVAKNYKTRVELARNESGLYKAALENGWIEDYTWMEDRWQTNVIWTKERVIEESKKYRNRGEFCIKSSVAYSVARKNKWLDELVWLKDERLDFSNDKIDCVYAYEFKEIKAVYVGRTLMKRVQDRDKEHLFVDTDAVRLFAKKNNIPVPTMKILEENLTIKEGGEKEGLYVQQYRNNGWIILNRAKTGGLGYLYKNKWTKKTCYEEAKKYKTRSEFAKKAPGAYFAARKNKWLDEYTWFEMMQPPKGYWAVYDNCYNAASECNSKKEFKKKYPTAYKNSYKNGWIGDYYWLIHKNTPANKKWYYENTLEEAKKCKTRGELGRKCKGAYMAAYVNGWLDTFFPKSEKDLFEDN
ncbi:MAG: hypothetical protein J6T94_05135 [Bacteroidaceae bacterium]|nr:hypothetical protein [Bacteroidaceae bacterium]